jgi:hypothetical protein
VRLNDKLGTRLFQFVCKLFPLTHFHDQAKMPHRHIVAIYSAGIVMPSFGRAEVRHNLVPMKIEVNPIFTGTAFRATQQVTIKGSGFGQGCDGKCQVKGLHADLFEVSKAQFCLKPEAPYQTELDQFSQA